MHSAIAPDEVLQVALKRAGSQSALGRVLGISQPSVHKALKTKRRVSGEEAVALERELGIPRHESRPDLFKPESDASRQLVEANR
ncbi:YdaS family helix-turn-helix protein [Roseisolibacter sp. H3M3-2]|nr:YdaS family helix-turn-helix protein [Roseisolibacter sp. H3M3-2]